MIREYAINPKLIASNYIIFQLLMGYFGVQHARVISKFPQKWANEVVAAADRSKDI